MKNPCPSFGNRKQKHFHWTLLNRLRSVWLLGAIMVSGLVPETLFAAAHTWSGATDGLWSKNSNWSVGGAPLPGETNVTLTFPAGAALNTTNNVPNLLIDGMTISAGGYHFGATTNISYIMTGLHSMLCNGANCVIAAPMILTNSTQFLIFVSTNNSLVIDSAISGPSALQKYGDGKLTLSGITPNTYTGGTAISQGILELYKAANITAVPGDLIAGYMAPVTVRWFSANQIADGGDIYLNKFGTLEFNNYYETVSSVIFDDGGEIDTGTGVLSLNSISVTNPTNSFADIFGRIALVNGGQPVTINVTNGGYLKLWASIADGSSTSIMKKGAGTIGLFGTNSYTGLFTVASGYIVAGTPFSFGETNSGVVVSNGAAVSVANLSVGQEPLTIAGQGGQASGNKGALVCSGTNVWAGPITLTGDTMINSGSGSAKVTLSGGISGIGNLTKTNSGTLAFTGATANSYSGTTIVAEGTLLLGKSNFGFGVTSIPGDLMIGRTNGMLASEVVRLNANHQIANGAQVSINPSGTLDLNDFSDTVGSIVLKGASVDTGVGTLTLNGNISVPVNTLGGTISGKVSLGGATRSITVADQSTLMLEAEVSDTANGGLLFDGPGVIYLQGSNSFPGPVTVNSGFIILDHNYGLGGTAGGTTVKDGASITLFGGMTIAPEPLTVNGNGQGYGVIVANGTNTFTGPIDFQSDVTISPGGQLTLAGSLSGGGMLTQIGGGTLVIAGTTDNVHAGTTVLEGTLSLAKTSGGLAIPNGLIIGDETNAFSTAKVRLLGNNQIGNDVPVSVFKSGVFDLNNFSDGIGLLYIKGGTIGSGSGTLTLNGDVVVDPAPFAAFITGKLSLGGGPRVFTINDSLNIVAQISDGGGFGKITKNGEAMLTLSGANTYSGVTTVNAGILKCTSATALGSSIAGTVVTDGATLMLSGASVTGEALTLNGAGVFGNGALQAVLNNSWSGPITLNTTSSISVVNGDSLTISGVISGPGGLDKLGAGTLTISGSSPNTYGGATTAKGSLKLNKTAGVLAIPGSITLGTTNGAFATDQLELLAANQIADSAPVTILDSGYFYLGSMSETIGALTISGGTAETFGGTLTLSGDLFATSSGASSPQLNGSLSLGGSNRTFTVTTNLLLYLTARVSDGGATAGLVKSGPGGLHIGASNNFSGLTVVSNGYIDLGDSYGLGSPTNGTVVANGASLFLEDQVNVSGEALTLSGNGYGTGALYVYGTNSWSGTITLATNAVIYSSPASSRLTLSGGVDGNGGVTKDGPGTVRLTGNTANTFSGATTVNQGVVELSKNGVIAVPGALNVGNNSGAADSDVIRLFQNDQIADISAVSMTGPGLLDLNGKIDTVGSLSGAGHVHLGLNGTLMAGGDNSSTTYAGVISGTGSGGFIKAGTGTLTLSGTNTHLSDTIVYNGKLLVNGQVPGLVNIFGGATLGGSGLTGPIVNGGGTISPGNSPGKLNCGNVSMNGFGTFAVELNGTGAGTAYDQLNVTGTVSIDGALLPMVGFNSALSNQFTIIANDGSDAVVGTFTGLPEGATLVAKSRKFKISYIGGDGNDVVLTQTSPVLPPTINSVAYQFGNATIKGNGLGDSSYTVEASTNLIAWSSIGLTSTDANGLFQFTDPETNSVPYRFYRLIDP